jgi:uncharacterized membrane protein YphA (DoxX/SURF4 family)
MKKTNIAYWIVTVLFAGFMIFSAIPNIMSTKESIDLITTHMGYPAYFIPFIGWAKLLGCIAILVPGFPRIKEWAYAGLAFDLIGATWSSIKLGDPFMGGWVFMLPILAFLAASYILYHKKLNAASLSYAK